MAKKRGREQKPEWVPPAGGREFATRVRPGMEPPAGVKNLREEKRGPRRRPLSVAEHVRGVLQGDRSLLARTITLVESNAPAHFRKAQTVLKRLLPHTGRSFRVGVTGVPGAGKSTYIEALGCHLLESGFKVAVLTVDPSSSVTRGSILGDKTRMDKLSRQPDCFIRPSPAAGTLGGVTRKSRETIRVCEAAGFDIILIETVGVGQSEITVRSMVDFFLLLLIPGAGDELQGIKRGVVEIADAVLINKADGDNRARARRAQDEYAAALKTMAPATPGWETRVHLCSALTGAGVAETWTMMRRFWEWVDGSGHLEERRRRQNLEWTFAMVEEYLTGRFYAHPGVDKRVPEIRRGISQGKMLPTEAAEMLLEVFFAGDAES